MKRQWGNLNISNSQRHVSPRSWQRWRRHFSLRNLESISSFSSSSSSSIFFLPFFLFSSTSSVSSGEINYSQLVLIQYTLCIVLLHHTFVIAEWICNPLSFAFAYKSSLQRVVPPRNRIKNPSNEIFHKNNFHVNIMAPLGGITRPTCWKSNNPGAPVASL